MMQKKINNMTQGAPLSLLVRFAIPLMLGNVFQLFYTLADSIVVGRLLGVSAFASVGAAGFLYWLMLSVVLGLTQGFGTFFAQRFGAKDAAGLRKAIAMSVYLGGIIGIAFGVLGIVFIRTILTLVQTPKDIINGSATYLYFLIGGMIITFFYNLLSSILRARGDSKTPLNAMILASVLNVILDIILVAWTPLGIAGAAIATLTAQGFACFYCFMKLRTASEIHLTSLDLSIDWTVIKSLLYLGVPMGLRNFIIALGGVAIQYVINGYGTVFVAGISASKKMYNLMEIIGGAIDGAIATYVAQNYGARRMDRIKLGVGVARNMLLVGSCAVSILMLIFGRQLLSLFISGEIQQVQAVLGIAQRQLHVMAISLPVLYMLFLYRSSLQGMGNSLMPMLSGFMELAFRILSVIILPLFIHEWGIYLAEAIGWGVAAIQLFIAYIFTYRKKYAQLSEVLTT